MKAEQGTPIELDFKSAGGPGTSRVTPKYYKGFQSLKTFTSYSFDKNILVPASAFRFTAPGIDKSVRMSIRSGDMVELFAVNLQKQKIQLATGFIDETDTHVTAGSSEYVLTGRDTIGQLIDNAAVDKDNKIIYSADWTLKDMAQWLVQGTRLPSVPVIQGSVPNGKLLFQINPSETKINTLQRYLEFCNCLVWASPMGQLVIGKPNFNKDSSGVLCLDRNDPNSTNVIEARVRRNVNTAIRQIVTVLQSTEHARLDPENVPNADPDVRARASHLVGRSVLKTFQYGQGADVINRIQQIGVTGAPSDIGHALSLREIAKDNMKVLDIELVVQGHLNSSNEPYDIDQIYDVKISEEEDIDGPMYVYACTYNLTRERGTMTTLKLCKLHTIVGYSEQLKRH